MNMPQSIAAEAVAVNSQHPPLRFLLTPDAVSEPISFNTVFPPHAPLEVDVGAGKGRFLLARARVNPQVCYVAIERMLGRVRKIDKKLVHHDLANVRIIHLEARCRWPPTMPTILRKSVKRSETTVDLTKSRPSRACPQSKPTLRCSSVAKDNRLVNARFSGGRVIECAEITSERLG